MLPTPANGHNPQLLPHSATHNVPATDATLMFPLTILALVLTLCALIHEGKATRKIATWIWIFSGGLAFYPLITYILHPDDKGLIYTVVIIMALAMTVVAVIYKFGSTPEPKKPVAKVHKVEDISEEEKRLLRLKEKLKAH